MKPLSTRPDTRSAAAARPPRKLDLDSFLPYRLAMLAEQVSQSLARLYSERHGITNPEWRALTALGQFGTMTATQIGRHSRMHKTKVSRAVAELEQKGLVSRRVSDLDMRVAHLTLTDKGLDVYRQLVPLAVAFNERLAEGLTAAEMELLGGVLDNLMQRSETIAREISESIDKEPG